MSMSLFSYEAMELAASTAIQDCMSSGLSDTKVLTSCLYTAREISDGPGWLLL